MPVILLPSLASSAHGKASASDLLARLTRSVNASTGLVEYRNAEGVVVLADAGGVIVVHRNHRAELEAGLLLAAARWSEVKFTGDARSAEIVTELAQLHRIRVVGPDGRAMLPEMKEVGDAPPTRPEKPLVEMPEKARHDPMRVLQQRPVDTDRAQAAAGDQTTKESQVQPGIEDEGPDVIGYVQERGSAHDR